MKKEIEKKIDLLILIGLIIANILEIFHFLPIVLKFTIKIFSFSVFFYVFYKLSLMRVLFGKHPKMHIKKNAKIKNLHLDILLLISFILMNSQIFFGYLVSEWNNPELILDSVMAEVLYFLIGLIYTYHLVFFITGGILIILLSCYLGFSIKFEKPSFMSVIHEDFFPKKMQFKAVRAAIVFLTLIGFMSLIFTFFFEWFVLVIETPFTLVMIYLIIFFFIKNRHHKTVHKEHILFKTGEILENFYSKMIELLHQKSKIKYLFSFLLVLHLLSDFFTFILPFLTTLEVSTLSAFVESDQFILPMLIKDLSLVDHKLGLIWIYFSIASILLIFMIMPFFIWYMAYHKKGFKINRWFLSFYYSTLIIFFLKSFFSLRMLSETGDGPSMTNIIGVGFMFQRSASFYSGIEYVFILSLAVFFIVWGLSANTTVKHFLILLGFIPIVGFITEYILLYFLSTLEYYFATISILFYEQEFFLLFYMVIFFLITSGFYLFSYITLIMSYVEELKREMVVS